MPNQVMDYLQKLGHRARVHNGTEGREQLANVYEQQGRLYKQEADSNESRARRQAMATDALQVNQLLKSGNIDAATMLVNDRLDQLGKLGADPSDTQRLADMIYNKDYESAIAATDSVIQAGAASGLLKLPGQQEGWEPMAPKTSGSQMIVETAPGQFEARDIGGIATAPPEPEFDAEAQRKYLQDARKGITALKKDFRGTEQQFNKLEAAYNAKNKVGDMALVIQLMKTLDPSSVVREGEQAQVQRTAGITDSAWNMWTSLQGTGSLTPSQRQMILDIGSEFMDGQRMATDVAVFEQLKYAEADNFNIERILGESAAKRWREPRFTAQNKVTGEPVSFSLYEVLEQAQEWGVRPADAINKLGISLGVSQ